MSKTTTATDKETISLGELSDTQFRDLVDRELRKDHPQTSDDDRLYLADVSLALRQEEYLPRWIMVLEIMKASSETQLGAKLAEIKKLHGKITQAEYEGKLRVYQAWKAGNVRFLHSVQARLIEARAIRTQRGGQATSLRLVEERNDLSQAYLNLVNAVEHHRQTILSDYDEPTDADRTLWEHLEAA